MRPAGRALHSAGLLTVFCTTAETTPTASNAGEMSKALGLCFECWETADCLRTGLAGTYSLFKLLSEQCKNGVCNGRAPGGPFP